MPSPTIDRLRKGTGNQQIHFLSMGNTKHTTPRQLVTTKRVGRVKANLLTRNISLNTQTLTTFYLDWRAFGVFRRLWDVWGWTWTLGEILQLDWYRLFSEAQESVESPWGRQGDVAWIFIRERMHWKDFCPWLSTDKRNIPGKLETWLCFKLTIFKYLCFWNLICFTFIQVYIVGWAYFSHAILLPLLHTSPSLVACPLRSFTSTLMSYIHNFVIVFKV